jgi:multiple sugar transport system substrate-binding protein
VFSVGQFEFPSYQNAGVIAEGGDHIVEMDDIYPSLLDAFTFEGTAYCPPKDFSTLALYYNQDTFDAAGVEYPTADWTWEDMRAAAEAITNADVTNSEGEEMTGFSAQIDRNRWLAFFYANNAELFNEEGEVVFDSEEAVEALNFYASFVDDNIGAAPGDLGGSGWNGEAFGRGLAAMTVEGNWAIGYLESDFPELNWGVAEIPTAPSGEKGTLTFTVCWAVSAQAEGEVAEAAWRLVNFLTGPEGAEFVATSGFGVMPARASFGDLWLETRGEEFEPFVAGAEYAVAPVFPLGYADFTTALDEATTAVLTGEEDAEDAIADAADVAREIQEEQAGG